MVDEGPSSLTTTIFAPISSFANVISTSFGHPLSTILTVKLDEKNYLLCRGMILAILILRGQKVNDILLVQKPSHRSTEPNPLYEEWCTVDQALSRWLFGSMTLMIAMDVVDLKFLKRFERHWKRCREQLARKK